MGKKGELGKSGSQVFWASITIWQGKFMCLPQTSSLNNERNLEGTRPVYISINNWLTWPNRNTWIYCWLCWDSYRVNSYSDWEQRKQKYSLCSTLFNTKHYLNLKGQLCFNYGLLHLRSIKDYLRSVLQHPDSLWAAASAVQGLHTAMAMWPRALLQDSSVTGTVLTPQSLIAVSFIMELH